MLKSNKFTGSRKNDPCPVCGRTESDSCRFGDEKSLVLCLSEVNGREKGDEYNGYIYRGISESGVWGMWSAPSEDWKKERPVGKEFRYPFYDKNGNKVVEEVRVYDTQGRKKNWMDPAGVNTSVLLPYRYTEAIAALKNGAKRCLILEGPPKADVAWELGIPAIAFANGFKPSRDSHWFEGYESRIVLVPDRDAPGIEKVRRMQEAYPMATIFRPWAESSWWEPEWLPKGGGKDFKDWVEELRAKGLSDDEITEMIEPERPRASTPQPLHEDWLEEISPWDLEQEPPRPKIEVCPGKLKQTREQILTFLASEQNPLNQIYSQGGNVQWLVRILKTGELIDCSEPLDIDKLTHVLDDKIEFFRQKKNKDKTVDVVIDCPMNVSKNVLSASRWPQLPRLKGICKLPILRPDGEVVGVPGYDPKTEFLLDFDPKKYKFVESPTRDTALNALRKLKELIGETSFKDHVSLSGALAMILTAVSRNTYDYAPLFAINANTPGAGKGTLMRIGMILASNSITQGMTTFHPEEIELKKQLLSTLQNGPCVVAFDNVTHKFGGANIETALTSPFFGGRLLGVNKDASFSTKALWMVNGNNLQLTRDMHRRTIMISLDLKEETAAKKKYKLNDFESHVFSNREKIATWAFEVLRGFLVEAPKNIVPPLNGFIEWSNIVRSALIWLGEPDPVQSQDELSEMDDSRAPLAFLLDSWYHAHGTRELSAREAIAFAQSEQGKGDFREALLAVSKNRLGEMTTTDFGYFFRSNQRTRVGNLRFVAGKHSNQGIHWKIEVMEPSVTIDLSPPIITPIVTPQDPYISTFCDDRGDSDDIYTPMKINRKDRDNDRDRDRVYKTVTESSLSPLPSQSLSGQGVQAVTIKNDDVTTPLSPLNELQSEAPLQNF